VIAITESDNDELDERCEYVIRVPSTSDFLTPLLCVLPLQVRPAHPVEAAPSPFPRHLTACPACTAAPSPTARSQPAHASVTGVAQSGGATNSGRLSLFASRAIFAAAHGLLHCRHAQVQCRPAKESRQVSHGGVKTSRHRMRQVGRRWVKRVAALLRRLSATAIACETYASESRRVRCAGAGGRCRGDTVQYVRRCSGWCNNARYRARATVPER